MLYAFQFMQSRIVDHLLSIHICGFTSFTGMIRFFPTSIKPNPSVIMSMRRHNPSAQNERKSGRNKLLILHPFRPETTSLPFLLHALPARLSIRSGQCLQSTLRNPANSRYTHLLVNVCCSCMRKKHNEKLHAGCRSIVRTSRAVYFCTHYMRVCRNGINASRLRCGAISRVVITTKIRLRSHHHFLLLVLLCRRHHRRRRCRRCHLLLRHVMSRGSPTGEISYAAPHSHHHHHQKQRAHHHHRQKYRANLHHHHSNRKPSDRGLQKVSAEHRIARWWIM